MITKSKQPGPPLSKKQRSEADKSIAKQGGQPWDIYTGEKAQKFEREKVKKGK